ncbi:ATP-binding protein [Streptomyces sp. B1866]|uniref:ATP-binding protein n=1 Tax=Streptomyces sp. B1866 TaxID=3075431 RepID=UPI00288D7117|nr:ATP-binding protein [Streptomyces sp. B1866]MDT3395128.1 ATP-binding protein [Streptomyces sp. B1866]
MSTTAEDFTHQFAQSLDLSPEAIPTVRGIVRAHLGLWDLSALSHDVALCLSELLSNVVKHTDSPYCVIVIQYFADSLRVAVSDTDPTPPVVLRPDFLAESGRGMALIDRTADTWGVDRTPDGKRVWFELRTAATAVRP